MSRSGMPDAIPRAIGFKKGRQQYCPKLDIRLKNGSVVYENRHRPNKSHHRRFCF